jgi:hypothetical protein
MMTEAVADVRRREDAAPRLRDQFANLVSLRLRLDDVRDEGRMRVESYVRPIVVDSAPAHFEIRCMEPRCDGVHDITYAVLHGLRQSQVTFSGEIDCRGMIRDTPCDRVMAYTCEATYRA